MKKWVTKMVMVILIVGLPIVFVGMVWALTTPRPMHMGVQEGMLMPLPETPNCVATQSGNDTQRMAPIPYVGDLKVAQEQLMAVLLAMPRVEVIKNEPGYVWVTFRSFLFRFPDDVEFLFDDANQVIHFRAVARLGRSDLGVNRKRMVAIEKAFRDMTE